MTAAPESDPHDDVTSAILRRTASEALSIHAVTLSEILVHAARQGGEDGLADEVAALGIATWPMDVDAPRRLAAKATELGLGVAG